MTDAISLTFEADGSIDEAQLANLPEDLRQRILSPEFKKQVADHYKQARGEREHQNRFTPVPRGKKIMVKSQKPRRPKGLTGRQWKRARKLLRKA